MKSEKFSQEKKNRYLQSLFTYFALYVVFIWPTTVTGTTELLSPISNLPILFLLFFVANGIITEKLNRQRFTIILIVDILANTVWVFLSPTFWLLRLLAGFCDAGLFYWLVSFVAQTVVPKDRNSTFNAWKIFFFCIFIAAMFLCFASALEYYYIFQFNSLLILIITLFVAYAGFIHKIVSLVVLLGYYKFWRKNLPHKKNKI